MTHSVTSLQIWVRVLLLRAAATRSPGNVKLQWCIALTATALHKPKTALGLICYLSDTQVLLCNPNSLRNKVWGARTTAPPGFMYQYWDTRNGAEGRLSGWTIISGCQLFYWVEGGHMTATLGKLRLRWSVLTKNTVFMDWNASLH